MLHAISTSDWHLEAMNKHFGPEGVDLQLAEIDKIYLYALENGISHIFVPGDITDTATMTDETKRKLIALLVKYDGKINTYYIGGNHDRADAKHTSMDLISQFCEWDFLKTFQVFMEAEQLVIGGIVVNFLPHPSKESIPHKKPCLNFVHCDVVGARGDNGHPLRTSHDITVDERDFTIGGHIHLYQELLKRRMIINGSPYQKTFGESLPKGFLEFKAYYSKSRLNLSHKFVANTPKFILETKIISEQQDFSSLVDNKYLRYRLFIEEGVVVPADLRIRYPNIAQLKGVAKHTLQQIEEHGTLEVKVASTAMHPRKGLKRRLVSAGLSETEIKSCGRLLKTALSEIGYS